MKPSEESGGWQELGDWIPGYRGYQALEARRESDRLQREMLARILEDVKTPLNQAALRLAEEMQLEPLPLCERLRGELDRLIGSFRGAVDGYSGFFDSVQVDEAMLERVYEFDFSLLGRTKEIAEKIEAIPHQAPAETATAIREVFTLINELTFLWKQREELLMGLQ
ncbi:Hypothetical protein PBC10988_14240 [Planctomycetales bacterium 10988]|nr:Hypothetical protein PBC10988_14240 [Planctomycetales bacterium 10988]